MSTPTPLRPLGPMEIFSSSRHHLALHKCIAISARYQLPSTCTNPQPALIAALASVVRGQPMLRVGILDEGTNTPAFSHIPSIDLQNHLDWRSSASLTQAEYEAEIATTQTRLHDPQWPDIETRPPWKLVIVKPEGDLFTERHIDIMFAYHHAIADGSGGREFHEHLLSALQQQETSPSDASPPWQLSFHEPPVLPESQEESIDLVNSYRFLAGMVWSELLAPGFLKQPVWPPNPIDLSHTCRTRIKYLDFNADTLKALLTASREHSVTLTALLHGLLLASLSRRLPPAEAPAFVGVTPISLRPWISSSANAEVKTKLRDMTTGLNTQFSPADVKSMRENPTDNELIWKTATNVKKQLDQRISTLPADDVAGTMHLISDFFEFWRKKDGKKRGASWQVTNVGVVKQTVSNNDGWKITRAMFTSGANNVSQAIALNVVSVAGGGLTLTLTYDNGTVDDELVNGVSGDLEAFAKRL